MYVPMGYCCNRLYDWFQNTRCVCTGTRAYLVPCTTNIGSPVIGFVVTSTALTSAHSAENL